jgi:putative nucleotidyltransferase with HDIG domain
MAVKIMNSMRSSPLKTVVFIVIGVFSILGQGLAFAPTRFSFLLQILPAWGNLTFGIGLCLISLIAFAIIFRLWNLGNFTNWTLLAIQAVSVFGIFFLLDGFASHIPETSFLFTGILTTLTVVGILINSSAAPVPAETETRVPAKEVTEIEVIEEPITYAESKTRVLKEQVDLVTRNLGAEKHRTSQLTFLNELSQQLESELDPPVAAQLAVNMLEHALNCSVVSLFTHEQETREFVALATAGRSANTTPPGYRQNSDKGLLGRVARLKKTQLVNDVSIDPDFIRLNNEKTAAEVVVPLMHNGQIKGIIEVCSDKLHAFSNADVHIVEGVALELTRAWERSSYNQRISELIQAGISLTILLDPQTAVQEVALLARKTLEARFVFITLLDQQGNFSRTAYSGEAAKLLRSLNANPSQEPIVQAALNAVKPFRVRDVRKYADSKNLEIDHGGLRSALAIPIRLHRLSIGAILVFGKHEGVFFSEKDESLADLLASQAAASVESSWLYQELRTTLSTTSQLYQLSLDVTQTEDLERAAELIVQAAYKISSAREAGIVLFSKDGQVEVEVELDEHGLHSRRRHPMEIINQAIDIKQSIFVAEENSTVVAYPLLTNARILGGLWMDIPESRGQNFANIQTLANQAAVTLERSIWLSESRRQAKQIEAAYEQLQETYDQTLYALMSALDARDRETEGHSMRVSRLATMMGEKLGLNSEQLKSLERGALLHDIGKIGISDTILHKPGKLTEDEWRIMRTHPDIGSRIVERIPFLQDCMPVVRSHHERWDGTGYPRGLKGTDIPLFARIFAVADVFDALTSKRSYRKSSTPDEALGYLSEQTNILFDPEVVEALALLPYADLVEVEKATS